MHDLGMGISLLRAGWHLALALVCAGVPACNGDAPAHDSREPSDAAPEDAPATEDGWAPPMEAAVTRDAARPIDAPGAEDAGDPEVAARRLIHWQLNVALPAGLATVARGITAAFNHYATPPDVFGLEECNHDCVCGADNRVREDGTCTAVGAPSVMAVLEARASHPYRARHEGTKAILYRDDRFTQVGSDFVFGAAGEPHDDYIYCAGMDRPQISQLGVFLRDNRGTSDRADDRHVVVSTVHWFVSHCPLAQLERFEQWKTHAAFGGNAGDLADVFLLSGDFNMYAGRSMFSETPKANWWISYSAMDLTGGGDVGDGKIDLVDHFHSASIDAEWTYPNPETSRSVCYVSDGPDRCRPDYVWGKIYGGAAEFISSQTDSGFVDGPSSLPYGDHRAVRTVVEYR